MKKWLTILSAVGISATSSSSVIACTYKSSSPVNYQKFTDFSAKNFNKLGEGRVLLYSAAATTKQIKITANDDQALKQSIKDYYEGDGSQEVKNLVASSFANYSKAVEVLSDTSMSVVIQNVQSIDESTYEVSFQIQQKTDSFTKKSELLSFKVANNTTTAQYQVLTADTLKTIATNTKITDDINARDSIFKESFVTTANFLLGLNPVDRQDLAHNGVMSLNHWVNTTNNFNNQWVAALKTGVTTGTTTTFYLPGVDSEGKQYQSIRAQINASELVGVKSWRIKFITAVITVVLSGISGGTITSSNYHQVGLYQLDGTFAGSLPPHLTITNTGVTTTTLESGR